MKKYIQPAKQHADKSENKTLPQIGKMTNPRSGCQHKAWGVSPRYLSGKQTKPVERATAEPLRLTVNRNHYRPLRGLNGYWWPLSWGSRPRLYADARSAG